MTTKTERSKPLIATEYVGPPIPTTAYDWVAWVDGDEEGHTGRGPTETEALRDLCEKLACSWLSGGKT